MQNFSAPLPALVTWFPAFLSLRLRSRLQGRVCFCPGVSVCPAQSRLSGSACWMQWTGLASLRPVVALLDSPLCVRGKSAQESPVQTRGCICLWNWKTEAHLQAWWDPGLKWCGQDLAAVTLSLLSCVLVTSQALLGSKVATSHHLSGSGPLAKERLLSPACVAVGQGVML